ncbi:hypothetical protein [Pelagibius sp. Alg239-R121]|uniref:hypothetical protein n=1 Tax=Pelagibius sp. Alg239-R121 TaxID=2993448 RepID=UPI0024A64288|nr:hypothetical protein [Pelagibius sp. Alg239-R121]
MPWNWNLVSEISQTASGIAVVISLLYLAVQIRFARIAAADASRTARAIGVRENVLAMADNAQLSELWMQSASLETVYEGLGKEMKVSAAGAVQVDNMCQAWMWVHWGQYKSIKTSGDLKELENIISVFYSVPPMRNCWQKGPYGKKVFDEEFVRFVETSISKRSMSAIPAAHRQHSASER